MNKHGGIIAIFLLVFAIRAMVPAGFMPDMAQGSGHLITICSGVEMKEIMVDENGQPTQEHQVQCPYSFLSAAMAGDDFSGLEAVSFRAEFSDPVFAKNETHHDLYHAGQFVLIHAPPSFS